jgi:hypothetical protein
MARVVFRRLSDPLWEARSYMIQAKTYWRRSYYEEALGYLRYAQDLLVQLPKEGIEDRQPDIEFAQQLQTYFRRAYRSEADYLQELEASAYAYNEAKGEAAAMRKEREEYHRGRLSNIGQLGLLRHDVGRSDADAARQFPPLPCAESKMRMRGEDGGEE